MAQLAPTSLAVTGVTPAPVAASAGGDKVANNGRVFLLARNTDGTPKDVECKANGPASTSPTGAQAYDVDVLVTLPATTGEKLIGPFDPQRFNDANGDLNLAYPSGVTGVTLQPFLLP